MKKAILPGLLLLVAACSGAAGDGRKIVQACNEKMHSPEVCECMGEKAVAELNSEERAALLTMFGKEKDKSLMMDYPMGVTLKAGKFYAATVASCTVESLKE